jgi:hypothetical protein
MAKLPNADRAIIETGKLTNYLLSPTHPDGAAKAGFFVSFGFSLSAWQVLRDALIQHAVDHDVVSSRPTVFGRVFEVRGCLQTPDGRNPMVLVVWIVRNGSDQPRLVTAVPSGKGLP